MKDTTLHCKIENIVRAGKPKSIKVGGKSVYISKSKIEDGKRLLEEGSKEGGILPLLTLIPLIASGVGVAGAVAGGAAGIAKAVDQRRHNLEIEKAVRGRGIKEHVKNFLQATDLENNAKKEVKKFFKNISDTIQIAPVEGGGLILRSGNGLILNPWK